MAISPNRTLDDDALAPVVIVPSRMTEEEFVAWAEQEEASAEWVNGELILMSPVHLDHCRVRSWLSEILRAFVRKHRLGEVFGPQSAIRLTRPPQRREPDILFVAADRESILQPTFIDGPPDFIAEIVSPESTARDWREKYQAYEANGVREYWIIDLQARQFHAYALDGEGRYARIAEQDRKLHSTAIAGFWIKTEWFWPETRMEALDVLRELGVL